MKFGKLEVVLEIGMSATSWNCLACRINVYHISRYLDTQLKSQREKMGIKIPISES